ncbi:MAG TPA: M67 family metallopeptidase [Telmatospirillum sp.]|nr:M67 family metallopeptidase [Telmatospirillum sp.]
MIKAPPVLSISPQALAILKECAAAAYPEECCGLLVGYSDHDGWAASVPGKRVTRVLPTRNRAPTPRCAFEVDPAAHIALLRTLREQAREGGGRGECVLGHYHSHPDHPPVPSAQDRAQACDETAVWVIVAASHDGATEIRAWQAFRDAGGEIDFRPMEMVSQV